mgnify:FL=1
MLKRLLACVVAVALMVMVCGCNETEIKTHRQTEVKDRVVDQHTVVQ